MIGLTGGIGAGKSEALAAFERLGAAAISADAVVHELLAGAEIRELALERWGAEVARGGSVDRDSIAAIVFEDPDELRWLESELHPRVAERLAAWREQLDPELPAAVIEVPLLFETGMEAEFDRVVAVIAGDELRDARLRERGQGGLEGRQGRQLSQAEKADRADHVIVNDGTIAELEEAIGELLRTISG